MNHPSRHSFARAGFGLVMASAVCVLAVPSAMAKQVEIVFEGTVVNTNGVTSTIQNLNGQASGYERMYYGATPDSPFDLPTALQTPVNTVRKYSLLGMPVQMTYRIDTDLLPTPSRLTDQGANYLNRNFDGVNATPYTPWLTGSLTINGVTQTYVGDRYSAVAIGDMDPTAPTTAKTFLGLGLYSQIADDAPLGYQFYSRLMMNVQIPLDLLNGPGLAQDFSFTAANPTQSRSYFNGYFATYAGHRDPSKAWGAYHDIPDLTEDSGYIRVSSVTMRTIDTTPPTTTVPEPSLIELVAAGALIPGVIAWRRRQHSMRVA